MTGSEPAVPAGARPAFYAAGSGRGGGRDWVSLLHPPYTAWHLSYVAIGAALARPVRLDRLGWSLLGFLLALGIGAHALDELHGHPLRTGLPARRLVAVAVLAVVGAVVDGWLVGGVRLLPFIAIGAILVFAYNLEWFGGVVHNAPGFALSWGAFPVLTGYYVQHWTISTAAVVAALAAAALSWAQRALSTPARLLRRGVRDVRGITTFTDGTTSELTAADVLRPLEQALKATSCAVVALAVALVLARH